MHRSENFLLQKIAWVGIENNKESVLAWGKEFDKNLVSAGIRRSAGCALRAPMQRRNTAKKTGVNSMGGVEVGGRVYEVVASDIVSNLMDATVLQTME